MGKSNFPANNYIGRHASILFVGFTRCSETIDS